MCHIDQEATRVGYWGNLCDLMLVSGGCENFKVKFCYCFFARVWIDDEGLVWVVDVVILDGEVKVDVREDST